MIYLIRTLLFCVLIGMAAAACSAAGEVIQEAGDDGSQVELKRGQFLVVNLAGNPTTGYSWETAGFDDQILRQVGEVEFTPDSELIGSGGVQTLRFEAQQSGQTALKIVYRRPWETGVEPLKTFSLRVVVR
jgi:inhibitor of cysteine peptidase